ncbi:MAG: bifunctional DNA primase/polymerase [Acidimicrobiia bacterium]
MRRAVNERPTVAVAAVVYARRGWAVFPCHSPLGGRSACTCGMPDCTSPGKHPRVRNGLHAATTDEAQVRRWWDRWPRANVGITTGEQSGLVVVDVDPRHGGAESLDRLVSTHGRFFDDTKTVHTGGGGWHFYFRHPGGLVRNDTGRRLGPGIDVRGDGGYVLAPPSLHSSGNRYELGERRREVAPLPDWLVDRLTREPSRAVSPNVDAMNGPHAERWAEAAFTGEMDRLRAAQEGTRNDTLNRIAFRLGQIVAAGALDERRVHSALVQGAQAIGLGEREAVTTVESGMQAGERHRRAPRVSAEQGLNATA